jgi:hypothetical protein
MAYNKEVGQGYWKSFTASPFLDFMQSSKNLALPLISKMAYGP